MAPKSKDQLSPRQRKFVEVYKGNASEAALKAGYSKTSAHSLSYKLLKDPAIKHALAMRDRAFLQQMGKREANAVKITRNDIINGLAKLAQDKKISSAARVSAYGHLKDIFGLSARNDKDTDIFAGWSKEELDTYARTGELPDRFGSGEAPSDSETASEQS